MRNERGKDWKSVFKPFSRKKEENPMDLNGWEYVGGDENGEERYVQHFGNIFTGVEVIVTKDSIKALGPLASQNNIDEALEKASVDVRSLTVSLKRRN
jgi:hypothetical protein